MAAGPGLVRGWRWLEGKIAAERELEFVDVGVENGVALEEAGVETLMEVTMRWLGGVLVLVWVGSWVGCDEVSKLIDSDAGPAEAAIASTEMSSLESALTLVALEAVDTELSVGANADAVAAHALQSYGPEGCVRAGVNGGVITYELDECDGPYGLTKVSGVALMNLSAGSSGGVAFTLTATDLKVGGVTMTLNVSGVYDSSPGRQVSLATSGVGTRGQEVVTRAGSYNVSWDAQECVKLDGTWTSTVGDVAWATTVSSYEKCGKACPKANGTIAFAGSEGRFVTLTFSGSDTATFVSDKGKPGFVNLSCTP